MYINVIHILETSSLVQDQFFTLNDLLVNKDKKGLGLNEKGGNRRNVVSAIGAVG